MGYCSYLYGGGGGISTKLAINFEYGIQYRIMGVGRQLRYQYWLLACTRQGLPGIKVTRRNSAWVLYVTQGVRVAVRVCGTFKIYTLHLLRAAKYIPVNSG